MSNEQFEAVPFFKEGIFSYEDAREIVWRAGNMALAKNIKTDDAEASSGSEEYGAHLADLTGHLFEKIDSLEASSDAFNDALPGEEVSGLSKSCLLSEMDAETEAISEHHRGIMGDDYNPLLIDDERLRALQMLDVYVSVSYSELKASQK